MWKDFSKEYIRKNRASSVSVLAAAFISALFLSLLCSLFFNFWQYEIEAVVLEEGNWQGRISGVFPENIVSEIENFANVETAGINRELSDGQKLVIDICFRNMRTIYQDMPLIAEQLGDSAAVSYHELLLSRYLIHDPDDEEPPLLMAFCLAVLLIVSLSLILIIHNAFAVSMNARVRQFGIFSGVGATPGQIRTCLMQEAAVLCLVPVLLGSLAGIALSFGVIQAVNVLGAGIAGRHRAVFTYHPAILAVTLLASILTIFISAWLPAGKLSKLTPLAAIRYDGELRLKKRKKSRILLQIFGAEGELAGNALKAQRKALRTSALSLTLSFLGFTLMLCFFTLSKISTAHTYFERYQDAWDVMVTVKDTDIGAFTKAEDIRMLDGLDSVIYQKAEALCSVLETGISDEADSLGGLAAIAGDSVSADGEYYSVRAPIIIMDDGAFEEYCRKNGIEQAGTGSIVLNRIWDSVNSNFRYKEYIPFLSGEQETILLRSADQAESEVGLPILACTQEPSVLREEYENYALVQFISLSTWKQIEDTIGNTGADTYIRILAENDRSLSALNEIEAEISEIMGCEYPFEMENRIRERNDNDDMLNGYKMMIGALCALLAVIGIANVFSNTLGFVRQRRREFARYMSVGMTPQGMRKMFCIEALVIAGRPVLITLLLTVLSVNAMITASHLDPMEFLAVAPLDQIALFMLAIFGFVALAYYLGARRLMRCSLADALKTEE